MSLDGQTLNLFDRKQERRSFGVARVQRFVVKGLLVAGILGVWLSVQPATVLADPNETTATVLAPADRQGTAPKDAAFSSPKKPRRDVLRLTPESVGFGHFPGENRRFDAPSDTLEEQLFADAADGRLDRFTPFTAALVASGVQDIDGLNRYQQKAASLVKELRNSPTLQSASPRRRAQAIFEFMHERVLRGGYDLAYTDMRRVFDDGHYNCVSATVLFNYMATELGFECRGLGMPGHAMSRLAFADGDFDVENTCPRWFQLDAETRKQTMIPTGAVDRTKAQLVTPIQLTSMIYYNRGVDYLSDKRFGEAAAVNAKAVRLDSKNATARGNLLATLNNWAIDLGNSQRFEEAIDLLRQGRAMDAEFEAFSLNFVHIHRQWIDRLCRDGRFEDAVNVLAQATEEMPNQDVLRKVQMDLHERWTKAVAASGAH
jgi:tetratricopeptide (TPR) repeat protein